MKVSKAVLMQWHKIAISKWIRGPNCNMWYAVVISIRNQIGDKNED